MLALGARCELLAASATEGLRARMKRYGEIAYIGPIDGLPGDGWIGVRLDQPLGKGDGSFRGTRYFECPPLHGAIVRPERVHTEGECPVLMKHEESLARALEERRNEKKEARNDGIRVDAASQLHRELTTDELVTTFWEQFTQQEDHVRQQVELFCEQKKQARPCEPAKEVKLDALLLKVNVMRDAAATAASLYLSPYDTRHTQLILSKLLDLIDTTRTTFAPRKKFTFRARARAAKSVNVKEQNQLKQDDQSGLTDSLDKQQLLSTTPKMIEFDELVHANKQNEVIIIDSSSFTDANDKRRDLNFSHLTNCVVLVCVETSAIRGDALKNCVFFTGAIFGSLWLEHCDSCEFLVACRQLRVHSSTATIFHLRILSHPIIEDCQLMQFGPYRLQFDGLKAQLERLGLQKDPGLWPKVKDFKWHKAQQSPNWSIRDPKQPLPKLPVELEGRISYD